MSSRKDELHDFLTKEADAARNLFTKLGRVDAYVHSVNKADEHAVTMFALETKDQVAIAIRGVLKKTGAVRYVFVDEAWTVMARSEQQGRALQEYARSKSLEDHPDRVEIIMLAAEDAYGNRLMGRIVILRPEHGPAQLQPVIIDDYPQSSGRFTGLIEQEAE